MDALPQEIISYLAVNFLSIHDKLSFLLASDRHRQAYLTFAPPHDVHTFCDQMKLKSKESMTHANLLRLYKGLTNLLKNKCHDADSRYFYSIERRRGHMCSKSDGAGEIGLEAVPKRFWSSLQDKAKVRDVITSSPFAYGLDGPDFVMVHTNNNRNSAKVTTFIPECPRLSFNLHFEVMDQDVLLKDKIMYLMPLPRGSRRGLTKAGSLFLMSYDLTSYPAEIRHHAYSHRPRIVPHVYKECGVRRLFIHEDKLLVIFPSEPCWTIFIYRASNLELLKSFDLDWFDPYILGQLFSADEAGPHFVLGFYQQQNDAETELTASLVTIDLSDDDNIEITRVPCPPKCSFRMDSTVAAMQLFLPAVTNFRATQNGHLIHYSTSSNAAAASQTSKLLIVLLKANGDLVASTFHNEDDAYTRECPHLELSRVSSFRGTLYSESL